MNESLKRLIEIAGRVEMTPQQREKQRLSFAYGSAVIENSQVTRQMVQAEAERLKAEIKRDGG